MKKTKQKNYFQLLFLFSTLLWITPALSQETFYKTYPSANNPWSGIDVEIQANGYQVVTKARFDPSYQLIQTDQNGNLIGEGDIVTLPEPDNLLRFSSVRLFNGEFILSYVEFSNPQTAVTTFEHYDADGNLLNTFLSIVPEDTTLPAAAQFEELEDGSVIIMTSYALSNNNGAPTDGTVIVAKYDPADQTYSQINEFLWDTSTYLMSIPKIEAAPDGHIFVHIWSQSLLNRHYIVKLTSEGAELWRTQVSTLERPPVDIVPTEDGGVWYWNQYFNQVTKLDETGESVSSIPISEVQNQIQSIFEIRGIAPVPNNGIAVTAYANPNSIDRLATAVFDSDGTLLHLNLYEAYEAVNFSEGLATPDGGFAFIGYVGEDLFSEIPVFVKMNSQGGILPSVSGPDLSLSLISTEEAPDQWSYHSITLTVTNEGTEAASGIFISIPQAEGDVYRGGNEYTASQGSFSPYSNQEWNVGSLDPGASATITINYFKTSEIDFFQYAQVQIMNESDADSTPGNGNGSTANEDDEAVYPDDNPVDPCNPDIIPPVFSFCPDDITVIAETAPVQVYWEEAIATDNCSSPSITNPVVSGAFFAEGGSTIIYTATDDAGNQAECSFLVTVIVEDDPPPPPVICDNNILVDPGFENGFDSNNWKTLGSGGQVSNDAYSGNQAMSISNNSSGRIYQGGINAIPGETYTLSVFAKTTDPSLYSDFYIKFMSDSYQPLETPNQSITSTIYQAYIITAIAPVGAAHIEVGFRKANGDFSIFADEWCLEGGDVTPPEHPDLTLENLTAPSNAESGDLLEYTFSLKNIGNGTASGDFNIRAYFSTDNTLSADDIFDGLIPTGNIGAGQTIDNVAGASVVPNLSDGNYYLILKVDADDAIEESNESNNTISRPISIGQVGEPEDYCEVESDFPWHEWISNIQIDNQVSYASGKSAYSDFTDLTPIADLEVGTQFSYVIDITYSYFTYRAYIHFYTDFNHNGIFEEDEFSSVSVAPVAPGNNVVAVRIGSDRVPDDAQLGPTRVRVVMSRSPIVDACTDISFGEIEDYTVNIVPNPSLAARIQQVEKEDIFVYPNPVDDELMIDIAEKLPAQHIQLFNTLGKLEKTIVVDQRQNINSLRSLTMDTSDLVNGIYFLRVSGDQFKSRTVRVLVQRKY